jgi:peptidyl-dipeptidase Dcp
MKKNILVVTLIIFSSLTIMAQKQNNENPLLQKWNTPHNTPPFDKIKNEHYSPAFDVAFAENKKEVDAICNNRARPDFENTIEALEQSGELLNKISGIFYNLMECESSDELQNIAFEIMPKMTAHSNDISLNPKLFEKIKFVYDNRDKENLNTEQKQVLEKTYKSFVRSGANLNDADKEKYREISAEMSELRLKFNQNVLKETNEFVLHITKKKDLAGLPQSAIEMAAETAKDRKLKGWAFDLSAPSYMAFVKFADNRELRKQIFTAYNSRAFKNNENDNSKIVLRIVELRLEMAKLLGYETYAHYVLEERMAKDPKTVNDFLENLYSASIDFAKADFDEVSEFAKKNGLKGELQRWDWSYYSEKLKNEKFSIDDDLLRPYFKLENVKNGIFSLSEKLYGITFKNNKDIPVYNPEVEVYEVYDVDGSLLAVLYMDFFPRATKRNGAWMTSFRGQYKKDGKDYRPFIQMVCNFTKPTSNKPSLLTFDETTTFLHEFGHVLHGILANSTYSSISGTSVYRDFVELPSQFMENYATEKEFLDMFAQHYETGETIPMELVNRIKDYNNFQAGYFTVRQLMFGMLDMKWHSVTSPVTTSLTEFEQNAISKTELLPVLEGTSVSVAFAHIFAGGYAAGYYGYKWAEVLDADAFAFFKQNGIFDKKTAKSFRDNILSKGGSEHPMDLYLKFRGQEPDINALLEREGLIKK